VDAVARPMVSRSALLVEFHYFLANMPSLEGELANLGSNALVGNGTKCKKKKQYSLTSTIVSQ
ncbi:hypothetical protein ACH5RR_026157, partial [Cinchona calisaya]